MATLTKTLKLPFLGLSSAKQTLFSELEALNTEIANTLLQVPKPQRRKYSSKDFSHLPIGSAWINQTIRNTCARNRTKRYRCLPLETNNQNWKLHKNGDIFSVSFNVAPKQSKRVPLVVHQASHESMLTELLEGRAKAGSLKIKQSKKGVWYACLSVSMEVPDATTTGRWIGVDRGQNIPVVAATPDGPVIFWKAAQIRHVRRVYAQRRRKLQKRGKHKAVKALESKEQRIVTHINHCISKELVRLAKQMGAGIRLEDLSGIRNSRQRKTTKSDASQNRDYWPFYQLEQFIQYKALEQAVPVEKVTPHYTSQTCHQCGALNKRHKHAYVCNRCGYKAHADANAGLNIRDRHRLCCPLVLDVPMDGVDECPRNPVRETASAA